MKNKMLWVGSVIILILSVICFVVFGVGTELIRAFTGDAGKISFGKYNGKDIVLEPGTDFANAVQNYQNYYQNQGQQLDQSAYFYIYNYAFNAAVQSMAYKEAVKESGYKPSGKAISRTMLPYFLDSEGKYDPKLYNQVSAKDKESLKANISRQLVWERFNSDLFGSANKLGKDEEAYALYGIKSSQKEIDFLSSIGAEKRSFDIVSFDKADYPESEIKAYGVKNISLFNTYSLSMLTVKEEAQAKKLLGQLTNGEITFEDAITEYSEKYYTDGDGKVTSNFAYQIKENLENDSDLEKITSLAKDSLSEVIKTNTGYSIYKCTGDSTEANIEESATFDAVKNYVNTNEKAMIDEYFTTKAKAFVESAKAGTFDKAAKESGVEVVSVPAFPLNYGDVSIADTLSSGDVKALANASTNEDFLKTAFTMKLQDISEPLTLGNYVSVITLTGIQNDKATDEQVKKVRDSISDYDENEAQTTLLQSKKVVNNVADTYFNKYISR
ncbi:MAG: SurA N-terminal domain-containing protein [Treponema sp.]|nr:SurA N-terminal domain-containing protein [Treponema sp.]